MTEPVSGPVSRLASDVEALCVEVGDRITDPQLAEALQGIRIGLREPLRVSVVGAVSAGKSTLVNTLLRRTVAPVGTSDTTRVVTWYRYDPRERVDVRLCDGTVHAFPLTARGEVPSGLEVPIDQVLDVHVYLSNEILRSIVVIDTPGLDSVARDAQQRTEAFLDVGAQRSGSTAGAMDAADVVVYVFSQYRRTDAEFLRELTDSTAKTRSSALNVVGVLSKVDRLVDPGEDPWPTARRVAERATAELAASLLEVIPVIGLLGQAARGGRISESDTAALRTLARLGSSGVDAVTTSTRAFLDADEAGLDRATRTRLLELLDTRGIVVGTEATATSRDLDAFLSAWEAESNIATLERVLETRFAQRAGLLKIHSALRELERWSYLGASGPDSAALRSLRRPLERVELDPALHDLRVFDFAREASAVNLPARLAEDLRRLAHIEDHRRVGLQPGASAAEIKAAAAAAAARWAALTNETVADPSLRRGAWDIKRAFELVWDRQHER